MGSDNGTRVIPDVLGKGGRVATVVGLLGEVQRRLFALEAEQIANGLADTDPAPGYSEQTVAELRRDLRDREHRIAEHYDELMPDVERALGG